MNRGMEIAADVADSPRSTIVEQVANGVSVRMAVLYLLLGGAWAAADAPARSTVPTAEVDHDRGGSRVTTYLVRGARLLGGDVADLVLADGVDRRGRQRTAARDGAVVIDADGLVALPGLVDLHTHLREPGREDAETVETGTRAAAIGGFTAVHAMANSNPVADTAGVVEQVWRLGRRGRPLRRRARSVPSPSARRRAARRTRHHGRLRRPRAGLLRRRQVRARRRR